MRSPYDPLAEPNWMLDADRCSVISSARVDTLVGELATAVVDARSPG